MAEKVNIDPRFFSYNTNEVEALLREVESRMSFGYARFVSGKLQFFHSEESAAEYDNGDSTKLLQELTIETRPEVIISSNDVDIIGGACTVYATDSVTFGATLRNYSTPSTPRFRLYNGDVAVEESNGVATYNGATLDCSTGVLTTTTVQDTFQVGVTAYAGNVESEKVSVTVEKLVAIGGFSIDGLKSYDAVGDSTLILTPTNSDYTVPVTEIVAELSYNGEPVTTDANLRVSDISAQNLSMKAVVVAIPSDTKEYTLTVRATDSRGTVFTQTATLSVVSIPVTGFTINGPSRIKTTGSHAYTISGILPANANRGIASLSVTAGELPVTVNGTSGFSIAVAEVPDVTSEITISVVATLVGGGSITETKTLNVGTEPELVDLGLPSGNLWADCNLGASTPEGTGKFFSWGNTVGHNAGDNYDFSEENYANTPGAGLTASITTEYDAAHAMLGGDWRMPLRNEYKELIENTDHEDATINGVNGTKFMKKSDHSVFVFFPKVGYINGTESSMTERGYYWSASYHNSGTYGYVLSLDPSTIKDDGTRNRYYGCLIRAIQSGE